MTDIAGLDCFGTDSGFAFELLGRHEEVEQGKQRPVDDGKQGLFLKAAEAVVA
ncbi:MAG: hypothetical protein LBD18_02350 [Treponema sp.]|nr:hypothetical protein [Treponema sp.]